MYFPLKKQNPLVNLSNIFVVINIKGVSQNDRLCAPFARQTAEQYFFLKRSSIAIIVIVSIGFSRVFDTVCSRSR